MGPIRPTRFGNKEKCSSKRVSLYFEKRKKQAISIHLASVLKKHSFVILFIEKHSILEGFLQWGFSVIRFDYTGA